MNQWKQDIDAFLKLTHKFGVRIILIGGGAVNFHGYQRHSADVDFWIDTEKKNLDLLLKVFREMGYEIDALPDAVKNGRQNISIKFSPIDLNLELITNFNINENFDEVYKRSQVVDIDGRNLIVWRVLTLDDLITSKIKSGRPKDLLDIQELKRIHKKE